MRLLCNFKLTELLKDSTKFRLTWNIVFISPPTQDPQRSITMKSIDKVSGLDLMPGKELEYGKSITDACIGWEDSVQVLDLLAEAVRQRRVKRAAEFE